MGGSMMPDSFSAMGDSLGRGARRCARKSRDEGSSTPTLARSHQVATTFWAARRPRGSRPGGRTRRRRRVRPSRCSSRRCCSEGLSVPRPTSRRTSSSHVGGSRKTSVASGIARAHRPRPLEIDLEQHAVAFGDRLLDGFAGAIAEPLCTVARSSSSPASIAVELGVVDEVVALPVELTRPRPAGGRRTESGSRGGGAGCTTPRYPCRPRSDPRARPAGRPARGLARALHRDTNSRRRRRCSRPRPPSRFDVEISRSCMMRARTWSPRSPGSM